MTDNATLARRMYDAWNNRALDELAALWADEGVITIVGSGQTFHGPEGAMQEASMWIDAFPDGRVTVDRVVAADPCVVVEYTGRGTHTGTFTSAAGSIPATGRSVTLQLCDVLEFRDARAVSNHIYLDTGSMMAQLGLIAGQAAATTQQ
jgi:steroid delta-isomerase-like uncharacterized protein